MPPLRLTSFGLGSLPLGLTAFGLVLGLASGCSSERTVFDSVEPPRRIEFRTYEGSGQVVHPDVIRPEGKLGKHLWMVLTPYPDAEEVYENPSVYRSRDGLHWEEPAPLVNPVAPRPPIDHNCDPDLVYANGKLHVFYLETQRRKYNRLKLRKTGQLVARPTDRNFQLLRVVRSEDGETWTEPETAIRWDLDEDPLYLSPCVVRAPDEWRIYVVDAKARTIRWAASADLSTFGPFDGRLEAGLPDLRPWHLDIFPVTDGWVALLCARGPDSRDNLDTDLWIGASRDLESWSFRPDPILESSRDALGVDLVYRSTGRVENGVLAIWYSGRSLGGKWTVGVKTFDESVIAALLK